MKGWLAILAVMTAACGRSDGADVDATDVDAIAAGQQAYLANGCRVCHGPDGRGDGPLAASLQPTPRDFTNASAFLEDRSVEAIANVIADGVPSSPTPMPSFAHLDETTRRQLAAWVLSRVTK